MIYKTYYSQEFWQTKQTIWLQVIFLKQSSINLELCFRKARAGKSRDNYDVTDIEKLRSRDGLVWTVGLTVEKAVFFFLRSLDGALVYVFFLISRDIFNYLLLLETYLC